MDCTRHTCFASAGTTAKITPPPRHLNWNEVLRNFGIGFSNNCSIQYTACSSVKNEITLFCRVVIVAVVMQCYFSRFLLRTRHTQKYHHISAIYAFVVGDCIIEMNFGSVVMG